MVKSRISGNIYNFTDYFRGILLDQVLKRHFNFYFFLVAIFSPTNLSWLMGTSWLQGLPLLRDNVPPNPFKSKKRRMYYLHRANEVCSILFFKNKQKYNAVPFTGEKNWAFLAVLMKRLMDFLLHSFTNSDYEENQGQNRDKYRRNSGIFLVVNQFSSYKSLADDIGRIFNILTWQCCKQGKSLQLTSGTCCSLSGYWPPLIHGTIEQTALMAGDHVDYQSFFGYVNSSPLHWHYLSSTKTIGTQRLTAYCLTNRRNVETSFTLPMVPW